MRQAALPKVLPPKLGRVVRRPRVAAALLQAAEGGAAWVQAPGGWGKTTAVAALAEDLKHPVIWLHVDVGDAEPLTFFHFLRLATVRALPRAERSLPVFARELAGEAALFARRFARAALESAPAAGATLVLDNLQDVPDESAVHAFVAALAEELAPAWRVFLVTREAPGRAYLKLRGQGRLVSMPPEALAFSEAELKQALRERGFLDEARLATLGQESGGWIAGALLLAMRGGSSAEGRAASSDPAEVFEYFATQALATAAPEDRELLRRTAFLLTVTPESASRLAAIPDAGKRLERLARDGVFTARLGSQPPRFRYHDLFRDYLRAEARMFLVDAELEHLRRASAEEALAIGDGLHGLELLCSCGAWEAFARSAPEAAHGLLRQGQHARLAELIRRVPGDRLASEPWLRYWLGRCEIHMDVDRAYVEMELAYEGFGRNADRAGQLLAAQEMPHLVRARAVGQPGILDEWNRRVETLADAADSLVEADLRLKALAGLVRVAPGSAKLRVRVEELVGSLNALLPDVDDPNVLLQALSNVCFVAWRAARPQLGPPAMSEVTRLDLERLASPLVVLHWIYEAVTFDSIFGDPDRASANALRAEEIAKLLAAPSAIFDATMIRLEVACDSDDTVLAASLVRRLEELADPRHPKVRWSIEGWEGRLALLEDDGARALAATARAWDLYERMGGVRGASFPTGSIEVIALASLERFDEALEKCALYETKMAAGDRPLLAVIADWIRVARAVHLEDPAARTLLAEAAGIARALPDYHVLRHASGLVARLCARALEWNIEPDFIRAVVARRRLKPPDPTSPAWPWRLRVRCLGGFDVEIDGQPLVERSRAHKSLELLQLAIALGGSDVPVDRLVKTLWRGEGRSGAQQAFDTTLHRLRKLLGVEDALRVADHRLSIDRDMVWVDVFAIEHRLAALDGSGHADAGDWREVVALYKGHFLPHRSGEAWADEARARLWGRVRRLLIELARREDRAQAERILYFIVDLDPLSEDAIAELMRLHMDGGRMAEALRAFRRCEAALAAELRVEPGAELKALAKKIPVRE